MPLDEEAATPDDEGNEAAARVDSDDDKDPNVWCIRVLVYFLFF